MYCSGLVCVRGRSGSRRVASRRVASSARASIESVASVESSRWVESSRVGVGVVALVTSRARLVHPFVISFIISSHLSLSRAPRRLVSSRLLLLRSPLSLRDHELRMI